MGVELYIEKRFSKASLEIVAVANRIIESYQAQGFTLTLRQLYYQFVARDFIENKMSEYKRLGSIINDARLAGLIDWEAIEDRTRNVRTVSAWESPNQLLEAAAEQYKTDLWDSQPYHVEVWIEKDALVGVIERPCTEWRVPYFACRGYSSQSEQWRAGKRFEEHLDRGTRVLVLHLGDLDPSGIDMTRDNLDRLTMFARGDVEVKRLALNMDQVRAYRPPPNPAKMTDTRADSYIRNFGTDSWELDALDPAFIADLIFSEIQAVVDTDAWMAAKDAEAGQRDKLKELARTWEA